MKRTRLKIALQKKGRLNSESITLLLQCGLKFRFKENALLIPCENLPIDLWFVRDDDIPSLVADGVCDIGIVGENVLYEQANPGVLPPEIIKNLGFSRCRLSIAVPSEFNYQGLSSLENQRIATSYPIQLNAFLKSRGITAESIMMSGSVEIAPRLGMADVICDLVSTGITLEENHLKEVETILESEAVLIKNPAEMIEEKQQTLDLLLRRINGVLQAQGSKYIMFHAPRSALTAIRNVLPGSEAPTILPLEGFTEKVAVHLVSREGIFWGTLEKLNAIGASHILVLPIEKMLV
jgi:ATP phosphoribosyltransferase